ncbi:MAG: glycoside hydrolase family 31 protein [Prevotellaceae bacterium]|nr:glycoside hydrolase family 31 protein [Prevotellaceae bacterium]
MKRILTLMFVALTVIAANAQDTKSLELTAADMNINVTFYSPEIIRVTKTPLGSNSPKKKSEVVTMSPQSSLSVAESSTASAFRLKSSSLSVTINRHTGLISFATANGKPLLKEKATTFAPRATGSDKGRYTVSMSYQLDKDEAIYGLGTVQDGKLNRRGLSKRVEQSNLEDFQNVIQSVKGWGIYWDNYSCSHFDDNAQGMTFKAEVGDCADYYFMFGKNADGVNACMRQLTGNVPMFPLWTYGFWQCRERYKSSKELLEVVDNYRRLQVPLDGIIQDWQYWGNNYLWNAMDFLSEQFTDGKQMIDRVHEQNAHIMISIWASFGPQTQQFAKLAEKDLLLPIETWPQSGLSHIWPPRMEYPSGVKVYDAYSPVARQIYWDHLKRLFDYGIDAWWMDSTDPDFFNPRESDFEYKTSAGSWRSVRNLFPLATVKGIYANQRKESADKRVFIMTRSAFAGQQHYGSGLWSGDVASTWDMLRKQVPAGLNYTMTGCPNFNTDIGGFFCGSYNTDGTGSAPRNPQYQELYVRWMQYGLFCPVFRSHGADAPREIYQFGKKGEPIYDAIESTIRLRYRLLPYIYSTAWQVTSANESYLRALTYDFASDKNTWNLGSEFMFGRSILATPILDPQYTEEKIFKEDAMSGWDKKDAKIEKLKDGKIDFSEEKTATKYLPKGANWYEFYTEKLYKGGRNVTFTTTIDRTAMFVKAGTILPLAPVMQYAQQSQWDNLDIIVYPGSNAVFTLYEDEGDNYNYERGVYSTITMKWNDSQRTFTVEARQGQFPGMLQNRKFNIRIAGTEAVKTVDYNGNAVSVTL